MKHISIKEKYEKEVMPVLEAELGNVMAAPRISKVVVNMGTGDKLRNKDTKEKLVADLSAITGQKPKIQPAKLSIAGFGLREGMPVGLTVTLRGARMYDFLDKLVGVVLPRLRDFRGVSTKSFDNAGNYTLGLSEHTVFPEIDLAKIDKPHGLEMTIVVARSNAKLSRKMLELLGMPFEKEEN
jgi:large subunit ribosomal protein L5